MIDCTRLIEPAVLGLLIMLMSIALSPNTDFGDLGDQVLMDSDDDEERDP